MKMSLKKSRDPQNGTSRGSEGGDGDEYLRKEN